MALLTIKSFGGIFPKVPPRYLPESKAQTALNTSVFSGSLKPLQDVGSSLLTLTKSGTPLTIYRFGQDLDSDTQYWFHWTTDVNVCRSQINGDTSEWTFYTGDGAPKATYNAIALSGSNYPTVSRPLGLPAPTTPLIATVNGAADETALEETRVYTYTWVNKESGFEFESAPADASNDVNVQGTAQTVTLTNFASAPSGYVVTHRRIYRATAGTYLFVAEVPAATTTYTDSVEPDDLGEELPSLTWLEPPSTLAGLTNLPNGILAGFTGRDVCFSESYVPYAWPVAYRQSVDSPIVGLGSIDTTLVVLTKGVPYIIQGSDPANMVVVKSELEQACISKRSIVSSNGAVIYASPDGLVRLSTSGSKVITEEMFTRAQWNTYFKPESIHAYQHDMKYVAFYDTGTTQGGFIYDMSTGEFILHNIYATAGYNDLRRDHLYLAFSNRQVKKWLEGSNLTYTWKSKKFGLPFETGFSCAQVQAETYPLTAKFYVNNSLVHTQTVTSRRPFRLPVAIGQDFEVQLEGTSEVFGVDIAQSMQELAGV